MCIVAAHLASGIDGLEALPAAVARPVPVPIRGLPPPPSRDDGMGWLAESADTGYWMSEAATVLGGAANLLSCLLFFLVISPLPRGAGACWRFAVATLSLRLLIPRTAVRPDGQVLPGFLRCSISHCGGDRDLPAARDASGIACTK